MKIYKYNGLAVNLENVVSIREEKFKVNRRKVRAYKPNFILRLFGIKPVRSHFVKDVTYTSFGYSHIEYPEIRITLDTHSGIRKYTFQYNNNKEMEEESKKIFALLKSNT